MQARRLLFTVLVVCAFNFENAAAGFICPISQYESTTSTFASGMPIPDNDVNGIWTPAMAFAPQPGTIVDVVVDLQITHPWVGDLTLTLEHTSNGGTVTTIPLLERPLSGNCAADLVDVMPSDGTENRYAFSALPSLEPLAVTYCPAEHEVLPGGCFAVAPGSASGFETFVGMSKGDGVWRLHCADGGAGDIGALMEWSVRLLVQSPPVSVDESSWGEIKASYRD